jgi:DNA-binding transcriptional regulator/RsmH inhibitor MraZ
MSKIDFTQAPTLMVGSNSTIVEPSSRLAIPVPWKETFRGSAAYEVSYKIGTISSVSLFPDDNFRWFLGQLEDDTKEVFLRAANHRTVDSQSRVVLPKGILYPESRVSLFGKGAYLQIVSEDLGEILCETDGEVVSAVLNQQ